MRRTVDVVEIRWFAVDGLGIPLTFRSELLAELTVEPVVAPDLLAIADVDRSAAGRRPPLGSFGAPEEDGGR